jgi:hypothetical protein
MTSCRPLWPLVVVALAGCSRQAIDYNNQVAAIHARLGTAVEEFGRVLRPAVDQGLAPSAEEFAAAAERLRGELTSAEDRSAAIRVPRLPQADKLYEAHQAFLAWERTRLEDEVAKIKQFLDESRAAKTFNAQSAHAAISNRLATLRAEEQRQLQTLHAAQRSFAEANGLKLNHKAE